LSFRRRTFRRIAFPVFVEGKHGFDAHGVNQSP
jgi:hypothetical protein